MDASFKIQWEDNIKKTVRLLRGPIIEQAIQIESLIDIYIASKYATSRDIEDELICLVLSNLGMNVKLKIFGYLINKHNKEYSDLNPQFYNDLCVVNSRRNAIAHYPAAFDELSVENFILFNKFTLTKARYESPSPSDPTLIIFEQQYFSEDDINGLIQMMDRYISDLRKLNGYDSAPDDNRNKI